MVLTDSVISLVVEIFGFPVGMEQADGVPITLVTNRPCPWPLLSPEMSAAAAVEEKVRRTLEQMREMNFAINIVPSFCGKAGPEKPQLKFLRIWVLRRDVGKLALLAEALRKALPEMAVQTGLLEESFLPLAEA